MLKKVYKLRRTINRSGQVCLGPNARNLPYNETSVLVTQVDKDTWIIERIVYGEKIKTEVPKKN